MPETMATPLMPSPETYILSESLSAFPDFLVKRSPSAPSPSSSGAKPFAENFHVLPPAMMRPDIAPDAADDIWMSPADFSPSSANTCAANLPTAHGGRAAKSYARAHGASFVQRGLGRTPRIVQAAPEGRSFVRACGARPAILSRSQSSPVFAAARRLLRSRPSTSPEVASVYLHQSPDGARHARRASLPSAAPEGVQTDRVASFGRGADGFVPTDMPGRNAPLTWKAVPSGRKWTASSFARTSIPR